VDHEATTIAVATAPAACSIAILVTSEAALTPSVITTSAPNTGHGGSDHSGFEASSVRKR
jgi:hypothetical protein